MKAKAEKHTFIPTLASVNRPDSFRSRRVYDSKIFIYGATGGVIGGVVFSIIGYLLATGNIDISSTERFMSAGSFLVVATIGGAGVLITALVASLYALFNRS